MKETDKERVEIAPPAVNDKGASEGDRLGSLDPRIRIIARAIGRHIAREQIRAREMERQKRAANDNRQE